MSTVAREYNSMLGRRFGKLVVAGTRRLGGCKYVALCRCDCGSEPIEIAYNRLRDTQRSCGCERAPEAAEYNGERLALTEIAQRSGRSVETIREYVRKAKPLVFASKSALGKRWGKLTVIQIDAGAKHRRYLVRCDCGTERFVWGSALSGGTVTSCGCDRPAPPGSVLGQTHGRLTIVADAERHTARGVKYWRCKCECGTEKDVLWPNLISGATKSCGCLKRDAARNRERAKSNGPSPADLVGHQAGKLTVLSLARRTRAYAVWLCRCECGTERRVPGQDLRAGRVMACVRCSGSSRLEKSFEYEGRTMPASEIAAKLGCTRNWMYQALREGKTFEEIGNGRGRAAERRLPLFGVLVTVRQIADITGLKPGTVDFRLRAGLTPEQIVARPLQSGTRLREAIAAE